MITRGVGVAVAVGVWVAVGVTVGVCVGGGVPVLVGLGVTVDVETAGKGSVADTLGATTSAHLVPAWSAGIR